MPLPTIPLPTKEVSGIRVWGLTRAAAFHAGSAFTVEAMPGSATDERIAAAEEYLLEQGCHVTQKEAHDWRESTGAEAVGEVIDAIYDMSALRKTPKDADPQSPSSGSS